MKVAILGFGTQGWAAYQYWRKLGAEITVCDRDEKLKVPYDTKHQLGEHYLGRLERFDIIVRSPSVHPRTIAEVNGHEILGKVTTVTNEFFRVCPTKNIVGVTGTKGKGTTSTLIAKMLEAAGKRVHLGGNIGIPPLDLLKDGIEPDDWVVLELANFQLIDLQHSPHIAICLMVVPEHLDWHNDVDEYYTAKTRLFRNQTASDYAIFLASNINSRRIATTGAGWQISYYEPPGAFVDEHENVITIDGHRILSTDKLKLLGKHNWQNVCAAVTAVWQVSHNIDAMRKVLTSFSGLEHRLEFVRDFEGVAYYDDSFGTTPETAIVAIQAFKDPKVVILGGSDKGASYEELAEVVAGNNVRAAVLIGEQAGRIQEALERAGFTNVMPGGATMPRIVEAARGIAQSGDIVLLSTGCASFGLFKNYKDRGDQFKAVVNSLV